MVFSRFVITAIAASTLASVASAFDAQARTNVAVYYVHIPSQYLDEDSAYFPRAKDTTNHD